MLPTIQIPVEPHVLKYIVAKHPGVFRLSRKHKEGKMLIHMLHNPYNDSRFDATLDKYTDKLTVSVSLDQYLKKGCNNISSRMIYDFNDFIDKLIKDEFMFYVETVKEVTDQFTIDQLVDGFMGKYNFDDSDITPCVLKQHLHRTKRKKREGKGSVIVTHKMAS
jgi:glutathionyl-hydroquinone reductase